MTSVTVLPSEAVSHPERIWTVVVGGGTGQRFGKLKQFEPLGTQRVIDHSSATARLASDGVIIVLPASDAAAERVVAGGATRTESVLAGLAAVPEDATIICVHDAARPLASPALYERVIAAVTRGAPAAIPVVPVTDTIKIVSAQGNVVDTPDRSTLVAVQTPQAFRADVLRAAHAQAQIDHRVATDDASLVEALGAEVVVVAGDIDNRKITTPDDLEWAQRLLASRGTT
jgi:2-C-methyl-D-erythritol 4-phosphate cytidylyltransferase